MAGEKEYFGKEDLKPQFLKSENAQPVDPGDPTKRAKESLKDAEKKASSGGVSNKVGSTATAPATDTAKTLETEGLYAGAGLEARKEKKSKKQPGKMNFLKGLPLASATILILGIGMLVIFGSISFLGPHLEALFTEATDTAYAGYNLRLQHMAEEMLEGKVEMTDYFKGRLEKEGIVVNSSSELSFNGKVVTAGNFKTMYNGDALFREAYDNATRGRGANFFDTAAENFYAKLGLSRDVFHNYKATGDNDTDTANYSSTLTDYFKDSAHANANGAEEKEVEEDDGSTFWDIVPVGEDVSTDQDGDSSSSRAKEYLHELSNRIAEETAGCTTLKIGNVVSTAVSSNRYYQAAHEFMTKMESISKAKAGYGDASAVNSVLNWFTTPATTTVYDPATESDYTVSGSPLESEGARVVLGNLSADKNNTQKYSLERSYTATDKIALPMGIGSCSTTRASGVVLSLAAMAVPGAKLISSTVGVLLSIAFELGVKITAESVLGLLVPTIGQIMYENPFTNAIGPAGGESFTMGAANANMLLGRQTYGATTASRAQVLSYNQANEEQIARDAEVDRLHHDPLDITSKNTFLGSLVDSLLPLSNTTTAYSAVSTLSSLTGTSLASLSSTYAASEDSSFMTSFGDCDKTEEIGATANFYCSAISTVDLSILDVAEDDPEYQKVISESVDGDTVKDGSPLADFIAYHMGRYSAPGIRDANIAKACKEESRSLPHLTSISEMIKAFTSDYCETVADGSRYVDSPDNPYWETEKWHQLWVLSWRVKCHMGLCSEDGGPVVAFQKHYEETHPLDNSDAGYLARISGLEKDEAENVIALVKYVERVNEYDATVAYKFGSNASDMSNASDTALRTLTGVSVGRPVVTGDLLSFAPRWSQKPPVESLDGSIALSSVVEGVCIVAPNTSYAIVRWGEVTA